MKDFLGIDIAEGDFVIATRLGYRQLILGRIIKLTAKKVRIEYKVSYKTLDTRKHLYDPGDLVKVQGPQLTMKLLKGK